MELSNQAALNLRETRYVQVIVARLLRVENYGVRVDLGMTDLFGLYVSVYDSVASYERVVRSFDSWGLSFGLTVKIPGLRALKNVERLWK